MADTLLGRSRQSRPIIAEVVKIRPAHDDRMAEFRQEPFDAGIKFGFAEVTAPAIVLQVVRIVELVGGDNEMANADRVGKSSGVGQFRAGHARAIGRDGDSRIALRKLRGIGDDGTIHAAAKRDGHARHRSKHREQVRFGFVERHGHHSFHGFTDGQHGAVGVADDFIDDAAK